MKNNFTNDIESFLAFRKAQKTHPRTLTKFTYELKNFISFLVVHSIPSFKDVTQETLETYRLHLTDTGYKPTTIKSMLSTLRRLFSYLEEHCLVFDNSARHLQSPRIKRTLPDVISVDQIKRLLAIPDCTTVLGLRNRAALELAYTTGMRSSELALLTLLDIDFTNATVRVFGKGQKERILPLGTSAVRYLKDYLRTARPKLVQRSDKPDSSALWFTRTGQPFPSAAAFICFVRRYAKKAKFHQPVSAHTLRLSCATHMLQNGAHPAMIANLLGHSDLRSLGQYLNITITDLKTMHKKNQTRKNENTNRSINRFYCLSQKSQLSLSNLAESAD